MNFISTFEELSKLYESNDSTALSRAIDAGKLSDMSDDEIRRLANQERGLSATISQATTPREKEVDANIIDWFRMYAPSFENGNMSKDQFIAGFRSICGINPKTGEYEPDRLFSRKTESNRSTIEERLYDDEAPYGRGEQYPGSRVKPWENKAPQWWIDQGGTDASWKSNSKSSGYEDEKDRLYREDLEEAIDDDSLMAQISECLENNESILIHSRPGSGIVSRVKSCIKDAGFDATYISAYTNSEHIDKVAESGQILVISDLDKAKPAVLDTIVGYIGTSCIIGINYGSLDQAVSSKFDVEINDISDALYTEGCNATLAEAADDEEIEIVDDEMIAEEPVEDTEVEAEPKQTIIECSKCGALVIVDEVEVDEESDLVNIKDECKFCEEKEGYKIVGSVVPYEATENDDQLDEAFGANKDDIRWSEIKDKHDFQLVTLADIKKGDRVVVGTKATAKGSLEDRDYVQYVTKVTSDEFNPSCIILVFSGPRYYKAPADTKCFKIVKAKKKMSEDIADVARKVFDKPASAETQQRWEDELNGEMGEISDKRRAQLEKKFAQQRDWEARHENDNK